MRNRFQITLIQALLLGLILVTGAYFRFIGMDWDENQHLHPDERFLTMVESSITPVQSYKEYFNTSTSTLNPYNSGYSFFVYGTLPIFIVRYVGQWVGMTGYSSIYLVGRYLSGFVDLLSIIVVFLIAVRLYKNAWLGLIASAFASWAVLSIQLSHFFTVDCFTNFFITLSIWFAVCIATEKPSVESKTEFQKKIFLYTWQNIKYYILFGISLGLAAASKINSISVAFLLPIATFLQDPSFLTRKNQQKFKFALINLFIAGFISFIVFRIFQPYAFNGESFFDFSINTQWVRNLKELSYLSSGNSNYPPSIQWARRSILFGLQNIILWGLGLPLGLSAILGILWMGYKIVRGEWKDHSLLWVWVIFYLTWQSLRSNPTMRYFYPIYPILCVIAAWGLWQLISWGIRKVRKKHINLKRVFTFGCLIIVLIGTISWAYAFTRIYTRRVTRMSASDWIYQNVEGAFNLKGDHDGVYTQIPLAYPHYYTLTSRYPLEIHFISQLDGFVSSIRIDHVQNLDTEGNNQTLNAELKEKNAIDSVISLGNINSNFISDSDPRGGSFEIALDQPAKVEAGREYFLSVYTAESDGTLKLSGNISTLTSTLTEEIQQVIYISAPTLENGQEYLIPFIPAFDFEAKSLSVFRAIDSRATDDLKTLKFELLESASDEVVAIKELNSAFSSYQDVRGDSYEIAFDRSIQLEKDKPYQLRISHSQGDGALSFYGSIQANETDWDDAIPLSFYGYNPFDFDTGLYASDLNFQMYWDENEDKRDRFISILELSDYIYITSNRQWGSLTQIPERYPLSIAYYRNLIGCPPTMSVQWCYRVAEPGKFEDNLGFELVEVFQSNPQIGRIQINSQFAEEAFTVYDHPKVFIFKKSSSFSINQVRSILTNVNFDYVQNLTPAQADKTPGNLTLPQVVWENQQSSGTWSELFNRNSILNSNQLMGVVVWYLVITLLGWICYPMIRLVFHGLKDKGYPFTRIFALLLIAFFTWIAGSIEITFSRQNITIIFAVITIVNSCIFVIYKKEIVSELIVKRKYFIKVEVLTLCFFLLFLLIRLGNPDLWHPYKGGEKPMDFSYFNAVLKSNSFPPYDPWFAGGYINYYYFGFVLAGVPVKWLGIIPSFAYNLILPLFFCMTAMAAFSLGWNYYLSQTRRSAIKESDFKPWLFSILCTTCLLIIGNQGTIRMIMHGMQRLASLGIPIESAGFIQRAIWTFEGFIEIIKGVRFNFYPGDWYWMPSRAIPGEPITEFPYFTFLYADPHAHLFALPLTLMALVWGLSVLTNKPKWFDVKSLLQNGFTLFMGGIILGSLRATNTWDYPTFLFINVCIHFYSILKDDYIPQNFFLYLRPLIRKVIYACLVSILLVGLSLYMYYPFSRWYGQAYTALEFWKGTHTPLVSFLTHWGLFIFIIAAWFIWEFRIWLSEIPLLAIKKFVCFTNIFLISGLLVILGIMILLILGVQISGLVIPLILLASMIILKKDLADQTKYLIFLCIIGLSLTLVVELVVLKGDIGRMNTVFKFYFQVWTLLSIPASLLIIPLFTTILERWNVTWRWMGMISLSVLLIGAALFPLTSTTDKILDRMSRDTPVTLDGIQYMKSSNYSENGINMNLHEDYEAILWMQDNILGSPVIVEGNTTEYRWGNRYSIYTGLPGVIGWNWHQRQQRALLPADWIFKRIDEVEQFYKSEDIDESRLFLKKYHVQYIILGQLERIIYAGPGLDKFLEREGDLWDRVYREGQTEIYQVRQEIFVS